MQLSERLVNTWIFRKVLLTLARRWEECCVAGQLPKCYWPHTPQLWANCCIIREAFKSPQSRQPSRYASHGCVRHSAAARATQLGGGCRALLGPCMEAGNSSGWLARWCFETRKRKICLESWDIPGDPALTLPSPWLWENTNPRQESKKELLFVTNPCQCHWALHLVSPLPTSWGVQFKLLGSLSFPCCTIVGWVALSRVLRADLYLQATPISPSLSSSLSQSGRATLCLGGVYRAPLVLCSSSASSCSSAGDKSAPAGAQGPPCPPGQVAAAAILLNCCWGKWQPPKWWVSLGHLFLLRGPWDLLVYSKNR